MLDFCHFTRISYLYLMILLKVCKINDYPYKFNVIVHSWASCVSYDIRIHMSIGFMKT